MTESKSTPEQDELAVTRPTEEQAQVRPDEQDPVTARNLDSAAQSEHERNRRAAGLTDEV